MLQRKIGHTHISQLLKTLELGDPLSPGFSGQPGQHSKTLSLKIRKKLMAGYTVAKCEGDSEYLKTVVIMLACKKCEHSLHESMLDIRISHVNLCDTCHI